MSNEDWTMTFRWLSYLCTQPHFPRLLCFFVQEDDVHDQARIPLLPCCPFGHASFSVQCRSSS
jgi:hypothetical protein